MPPSTNVSGNTAATVADLADAVLHLARELKRVADAAGTLQLTAGESRVMRYLDRHPGSTPSDVAHATGVLRSNLSHTLRKLEEAGMVERTPDPDDARTVRLTSTARAASNLELLKRAWVDALAPALPPDAPAAEVARLLASAADAIAESRRG